MQHTASVGRVSYAARPTERTLWSKLTIAHDLGNDRLGSICLRLSVTLMAKRVLVADDNPLIPWKA
jgi:hypothetical protein